MKTLDMREKKEKTEIEPKEEKKDYSELTSESSCLVKNSKLKNICFPVQRHIENNEAKNADSDLKDVKSKVERRLSIEQVGNDIIIYINIWDLVHIFDSTK